MCIYDIIKCGEKHAWLEKNHMPHHAHRLVRMAQGPYLAQALLAALSPQQAVWWDVVWYKALACRIVQKSRCSLRKVFMPNDLDVDTAQHIDLRNAIDHLSNRSHALEHAFLFVDFEQSNGVLCSSSCQSSRGKAGLENVWRPHSEPAWNRAVTNCQFFNLFSGDVREDATEPAA